MNYHRLNDQMGRVHPYDNHLNIFLRYNLKEVYSHYIIFVLNHLEIYIQILEYIEHHEKLKSEFHLFAFDYLGY